MPDNKRPDDLPLSEQGQAKDDRQMQKFREQHARRLKEDREELEKSLPPERSSS